jgi:uncharacterized repeat protein (TIGR03803 family)
MRPRKYGYNLYGSLSLSPPMIGIVTTWFLLSFVLFAFMQNAYSDLTFQVFSAFGTNFGSIQKPNAGLTQGTDGKLYGTTGYSSFSGPQIFTMTLDGQLTNLPTYYLPNAYPCSPAKLLQSTDGNLYGTTVIPNPVYFGSSPASGIGTLFKIAPDGSVTPLDVFWGNGTNGTGAQPLGALIETSDGTLLGTTYSGGVAIANQGNPYGYGTVFEFRKHGTFSGFLSFALSQSSAFGPRGGLTRASDGEFYGTTSDTRPIGTGTVGFSPGVTRGTIFRISSEGNFAKLFTFYGTNGSSPTGTLLQGFDGALYGVTSSGGSSSNGTVFKYSTDGTFTSLFSFSGINGANPNGDLIQLTDGNLYGTTIAGGSNNLGTIFRITTHGALTSIFSFKTSTGYAPPGGLCLARDGNLYGTTSTGGLGAGGTIFRLVQSPTVASTVQSNGIVRLNWPSFAGAAYRVEYRTNLLSGPWLPLITNLISTGGTSSFSDSTSGDAQRFYRVVLLPH